MTILDQQRRANCSGCVGLTVTHTCERFPTDGPLQALRRAVHDEMGGRVEDPRLKPLPRCFFCGDEMFGNRGQHEPDFCTRGMLKRILELLDPVTT